MSTRLSPRIRSEKLACAVHVEEAATQPGADPFFVEKVGELVGESGPAYRVAMDALRRAEAATDMAHDEEEVADSESDKAGSDYFKALRLNCSPEVATAVQGLLGGRSPSEVMKSTNRAQLFNLDRFFTLLDARTDLKTPSDRLADWKAKHEVMRVKVNASVLCESAQRDASAAADAAEVSFASDYRLLVQHLNLLWGEEKTRAALLSFPGR
ncbi:hypothetical protein L6R46_27955 [Myxococcota bacterium]|jgi:hypothetical protein|nr:hypothetical protein [Myxococcota bacterium]